MKLKGLFLAGVVALAAAASLPAGAQTIFTATIDGAQAGTGSPGTGSGTFTLSADETSLSYSITFSGLQGTETVSHIHLAPPGVSGGVVHPLPLGSPKVGVWSTSDATFTLTPALVDELKAGNLYVNIHSTVVGSGEIRGQIVPEPSSMAVLASGAAGLLALRRRKG